MSKHRKDVEAALEKKGFVARDGDHTFYIYYTLAGRKTLAKTKVSRSGKDIPTRILSLMARQCKLTVPQFHDLINCPLSREQYEVILSGKNLI